MLAVTALGLGLLAAGCAGGGKKPTQPAKGDPAEKGKVLFGQLGCNACHSTDGKAGACPTQQGVYGSEVKLVGGEKIKADEAYLRESILEPDKKIVEGYSKGVMAAAVSKQQVQKGDNLENLVAYLKTLKGEHPAH